MPWIIYYLSLRSHTYKNKLCYSAQFHARQIAWEFFVCICLLWSKGNKFVLIFTIHQEKTIFWFSCTFVCFWLMKDPFSFIFYFKNICLIRKDVMWCVQNIHVNCFMALLLGCSTNFTYWMAAHNYKYKDTSAMVGETFEICCTRALTLQFLFYCLYIW